MDTLYETYIFFFTKINYMGPKASFLTKRKKLLRKVNFQSLNYKKKECFQSILIEKKDQYLSKQECGQIYEASKDMYIKN